MNCPFCGSDNSKVVDSRTVNREGSIRRRRECLDCSQRYTTYEYVVSSPLLVIKKNGARVEYDRQHIEQSIRIATNKRPVSADRISAAVSNIQKKIEELGKAEVPSAIIGDLVMEELAGMDKVAYIRFASVYRQFEDIGEFKTEIEQLEEGTGK